MEPVGNDLDCADRPLSYAESILDRLDTLLNQRFPVHPFDRDISRDEFETMIPDYVAMSTAFPFIQAGALCACFESYQSRGIGVDERLAVSTAVAAYVVWDEFGAIGGNTVDGLAGIKILPNFDRKFHFALLTRDLERLLGRALGPCLPGTATAAYLAALKAGLSDPVDNQCIVHMLAFERHAMAMISSLDRMVKRIFGPEQARGLEYFDTHVGSDSEGEAIHVAMTGGMINRLVEPEQVERFLDRCVEAYALSYNWCEQLMVTAPSCN